MLNCYDKRMLCKAKMYLNMNQCSLKPPYFVYLCYFLPTVELEPTTYRPRIQTLIHYTTDLISEECEHLAFAIKILKTSN